MNTRLIFPAIIIALLTSCSPDDKAVITMESLLREMADLQRLAICSDDLYRTVQYSSYDRRSRSVSDSGWFANEDGFGKEPVPGFAKVLREPDSAGIGEYLICDVNEPGVIQRLWSAGITGKIRLYIDDPASPLYEGDAQQLFHNILGAIMPVKSDSLYRNIIRQFDASYFPVPFSKSCRIEWTGNINELHFYHVGLRIYKKNTPVESFRNITPKVVKETLDQVNEILLNPDKVSRSNGEIIKVNSIVDSGQSIDLLDIEGEKSIEYFSMQIKEADMENVLRKCVLTVYFDYSSVPQVHVPLGDFFGSGPGVNSYESLPFSVKDDGTMICRFIMPFKSAARMIIENRSSEPVNLDSELSIIDSKWEEDKTMHFRCRWKIDHDIDASCINIPENTVSDIVYLTAMGKGRIAGTSAMLYNPSNAPVSWGNWWGEGDEKIFMDHDTFPSFFGTGSEDYFNYSWSSSRIFSYPYCGQPRNDGPGNRGYVSNYRWHIFDDIPFNEKIAFYMELGHHGNVPGFVYGRTVYFYALPGTLDDFKKISEEDIQDVKYVTWSPIAYLGSAGFRFIEAESLLDSGNRIKPVNNNYGSENSMIEWAPDSFGEKISFMLNIPREGENNLGFTLLHNPDGGRISVYVNNMKVKLGGMDVVDLKTDGYTALDNHFTGKINLKAGVNKITLNSESDAKAIVGIDFIWVRQ